mgnify:CR=1 FL=1
MALVYMSDTEAPPPTEVKPAKRQMSPEARERMLANLKKGRETKARKNAERKALITSAQKPEPRREEGETLGQDNAASLALEKSAKLTCQGCGKVFKHSSSKSKHVKTCKVLHPPVAAAQHNVAVERQPRRRKKQKVTIVESDSESSSSSEEEELVIHKKRRKRKNIVIESPAPAPAPAPAAAPAPAPAPKLSEREIRARREQEYILRLARSMGHNGF